MEELVKCLPLSTGSQVQMPRTHIKKNQHVVGGLRESRDKLIGQIASLVKRASGSGRVSASKNRGGGTREVA